MALADVAIPVWNEAESIGRVVAEILAATPPGYVGRVIVADGGSIDETEAVARAAGAEVIAAGRGYGRACLEAARAADAEIVVFMDGDGADDLRHIADLVGPIRDGTHDFVVGSRVRGQLEPGAMAWHQLAAGRAAGLAMSGLYGVRYTDMCAFRAIRREALFALGMREMTYGWNLEMQMRAAQVGLRILEVPVNGRCRIGGASKVAGSLRGTLHAGPRILATLARVAAETRSMRTRTRRAS